MANHARDRMAVQYVDALLRASSPREYLRSMDSSAARYFPTSFGTEAGEAPRAVIFMSPWRREGMFDTWENMRSAAEQLRDHGWSVRFFPDSSPSVGVAIGSNRRLPGLLRSRVDGPLQAAHDFELVRVSAPTLEIAWRASETLEVLRQPITASLERDVLISTGGYWDAVIREMALRPELMYQMPPRGFEELVAELLTRQGLDVQLTPSSRDGGRDVLAWAHSPLGRHLFLVECKRYAADRPVGVGLVRALYGVVEHERSTAGILVTTSSFTRGAVTFATHVPHRLSLADYGTLRQWLTR